MFTNDDALAWWGIADSFILSIFNDLLQGKSPDDYFKDDQVISNIYISLKTNDRLGYILSFTCNATRPPNGIEQALFIRIYPLHVESNTFLSVIQDIGFKSLMQKDKWR